jgi:hypothetical protein
MGGKTARTARTGVSRPSWWSKRKQMGRTVDSTDVLPLPLK